MFDGAISDEEGILASSVALCRFIQMINLKLIVKSKKLPIIFDGIVKAYFAKFDKDKLDELDNLYYVSATVKEQSYSRQLYKVKQT